MKKIITILIAISYFALSFNLFAQEKIDANIKAQRNDAGATNITKIPDGPRVTKTSKGNLWSQQNNWEPKGVPTANDDVIINSNMSMNMVSGVCNTLTINSGFTLTMIGTSSLTVSGNVTNNGTITLNAGNSNTSTWLYIGGNFINNGTFTETASYCRFSFNGNGEQSFTNNGTITAPMTDLSVNNGGLTIYSSNNIIVTRVNLFYGTVTNSSKLTLGNGGTTYATIQRGLISSTLPAGNFDVSPVFNVGSGGLNLVYDYASQDYTIDKEIPSSGDVYYIRFYPTTARTITLAKDVSITNTLDFYTGNVSTFAIGANTLTLTGTIAYTSGSFQGGTSSNLVFSGTSAQSLPVTVTNGLNNLTINNSAGVTLNANISVYGTLFLTSGILTNGTRLTLGNGATINRSKGTLSAVPTFTTSINVIYSGTNAITTGVEIPTSTTILNNLTINNSAGVTLSSNTTVNGQLILTDGILNTGTNSISFGTNAINPAESNSSYISGNAVMLSRNIGTASLDFLGVYLHSGSDLGNVTITRKTGTEFIYNGNPSIKCNWDIVPENNPPSAPRFVDFTWIPVFDGSIIFTGTNKGQMYRSTNNGSTWTSIGDAADISILNPRKLQNISADHFSIWTSGGTEGPLPVKLASFNFAVTGRDINLNWITESEENNSGFDVEKSVVNSEQSRWEKVGFVQGKGTKNSPTNYTFEDKNLQSGKYKYRLKQIDYNGNFEYFELNNVVEVGVPNKFDLSQNYPNPFNPVTKINFAIPESGLVQLKVYDILGKEVATVMNEIKDAGYYTITLDASSLSSGVYFYRLSSNGFSSVKRMAVIK